MPTRAEEIAHNLESVRLRLRQACEACGRDPATVRLVAIIYHKGCVWLLC